MTNLFIIGNGFDVDHKLKTSYEDFRSFLLEEHQEINMDYLQFPEPKEMPDGEVVYEDVEVLSMLFYLINNAEGNQEKWSDIETSLGYLDYNDAFDWLEEIQDKDGSPNYWEMASRNEIMSSQLIVPTLKIQEYFWEWINTIDSSSVEAKESFVRLLKKEDQFLTFNYTETLEDVYGINESNICYIHGKQYEEIFFGHGNDKSRLEEFMRSNIGTQDHLDTIDRQLRKDTSRAFKKNRSFFEQLSNLYIGDIYSYGFSFSKVDGIYLREIMNRINTEEVVWHFNNFDCDNIELYKRVLKEHGFKGTFDMFKIS